MLSVRLSDLSPPNESRVMPLNCFTLRRFLGLLVMLTPASAFAHARLLRSEPASGSQVSSLSIIRLWFSERPNVALTSLTLRDENGARFSVITPQAAADDPTQVSFSVSTALPAGHYTISWRTVASDGHPSQGHFSFVVSGVTASSSPALQPAASTTRSAITTSPPPMTDADDVGSSASTANSLARAISFGAILLVVGVVVFNLMVVARCNRIGSELVARMESRAATLGVAASVVAMIAGFLRIFLESRMMAGMPGMEAMGMSAMVLHTFWGFGMQLQILAAFVAVMAFVIAIRRVRFAWMVASLAAAALALAPAFAGHAAASVRFQGVMILTDFVHVVGAASWLGNLACVMLIGVPLLVASNLEDRWLQVSALVITFSEVALGSAAVVVVSGVITAAVHLGSLSALWSTTYGRVLLLKVAIVLLTLAMGAYNFRRVQPQLAREQGTAQLRRSATLELMAAALVVIITGFLTGVSP